MANINKITLPNGTSYDIEASWNNVTGKPAINQEAYLQWGGRDLSGSFAPIDASMIDVLGANRMAFINKYKNNDTSQPRYIAEYSRDNGTTWSDYGASVDNISNIFNGVGSAFYIGRNTDSYNSTTKLYASSKNHRLRFRLFADGSGLYNSFLKFAIYVSTNGSSSCWVMIKGRLQSNVESGTQTYATLKDKTYIGGWSGWNIINNVSFTWYGNSSAKTSQYGEVIFEFGCDDHTEANLKWCGLQVAQIRGFGGVGWATPSNLARYGHLYSYDANQNAYFPAQVTATRFNGNATSADSVTWGNVSGKPDFSKYLNYPDSSPVRILPRVSYTTIDPTHTDSIYFKELLKWICTNYPNDEGYVYIGSVNPNITTYAIIRIYSNKTIDSNGYPQYASGIYTDLSGNIRTFGMVNYAFQYQEHPVITESTVSGWGFTKNTGTVTSVAVKMNNTVKGTVTSNGTIDLGTVITSHQSLSGYATQAWVNQQGFAKESDIPTIAEIEAIVDRKLGVIENGSY